MTGGRPRAARSETGRCPAARRAIAERRRRADRRRAPTATRAAEATARSRSRRRRSRRSTPCRWRAAPSRPATARARVPSWSTTPDRSRKRQRVPPASLSHERASSGCSPPAGSTATSVSKTSGRSRLREADAAASFAAATGSSVRTIVCVSTRSVPPYCGRAAPTTGAGDDRGTQRHAKRAQDQIQRLPLRSLRALRFGVGSGWSCFIGATAPSVNAGNVDLKRFISSGAGIVRDGGRDARPWRGPQRSQSAGQDDWRGRRQQPSTHDLP